jgi:anaerobic selenocysteine-containing dehydrogenase
MVETYPLKRLAGTRRPHDAVVRTVCGECTVGCGVLAYLKEGEVVDVQGDEKHPVSGGGLCAKGIAFPQGLRHPDRVSALSRRQSLGDGFQTVNDWEKALDDLAEQLRKIQGRYGPRSLMIGCDPDAGLDFYVGAVRFARLWGTPHVFHPYHSPGGVSDHPHSAAGSVPHCLDWVHSRCILLVEADLATTHPVVFSRLLEARDHGARIIALDSRFTPTMSKADVAVRIKPESGNRVGLALMKAMIEENLCDPLVARQLFGNHGTWKESFQSMPYEGLDEVADLSVDKVRGIARRMAAKAPVTVITGKRLAHRPNSSIWLTMTMAAGWSAMRGGGWYPLDAVLPPFDLCADINERDAGRGAPEGDREFGTDIESSPELSQTPERPVKALVCSGNCLYDFMSPFRSIARSTELNITFSSFPNETCELSHAVIPAALWPEKEGLAFSNDRAIQWGGRIVEPLPGTHSGLDLWMGLAKRLANVRHMEWQAYFPWKRDDGSADLRSFYAWLLHTSPSTSSFDPAGLTADGARSAVWTVATSLPPSDIGQVSSARVEPLFAPSSLLLSSRPVEADLFPLVFQATRVVSRSGDASSFWPWTKDLEDPNEVQIHPQTAQALGVENGDTVLIQGQDVVMEARAWITRMVPRSMVWSSRKLGASRVVVHKKGRSLEDARQILRELLR